jgi:undecaprenyl-diphosphatase
MTIFQSFLLGIVQGLTEFIPVSSTAHLLLAQYLLKIDPASPGVFAFNVLVQLGTWSALVVYFWADLWSIGLAWFTAIRRRQPFGDPQARLGWYLILGTVPALAAGAALKPMVEWLFSMQMVEALIRLGLSVALLVVAEVVGKRNRTLEHFHWKDALWVGFAQVLAIFPGSSRSGSTIAGGMTRNLDRPSAARFSFLLSVPIMLAAGAYEAIQIARVPDLASLLPSILVGFVTAAVVGYLAVRWLLAYLVRHSLYDFAIYCVIVGMVSIIFWSIGF